MNILSTTYPVMPINQLYPLLLEEVQGLKPLAKQGLQRLYKQFSQGLQPRAQDYQQLIQDSAQEILCIGSRNHTITSCFGCQYCSNTPTENQNQTEHVVEWGNAKIYAWCIWDAFFIAKIVGETAKIYTVDPVSKHSIELEFKNDTFKVEPCWFTFPLGETQFNDSIRACFCCRTKAFTDISHAQHFARQHNCEVVDISEMLARTDEMVAAFQ